ncbi:flotillin family protein [Dactylosporangium sucinum]|uniref:Flotillin n=1 Tax=Dactylosporangium sucinum TaxID=1424081 RepID=A0A917X6S2_9ACTN|nr:flotillin family protein [Dactylosporangium sucinum]GGM82890.1 flotillin [Dactylosporangium sucinum]
MTPLVIAVGGLAVLAVLVVASVLARVRVAGPNEAFIVTGRKGHPVTAADGSVTTDLSGQKVVMGAAVFVLPVVQRLHVLDLSSREIPVQVTAAVSKQGIRCDADAVAIVKVGGTAEMIRPAAQRFLHQQDRIEAFTAQVLAGALRSVVGRLTVEEIIRDRAGFAAHVAEEAERTLTHQGLVLDVFQLEDIRTAGTYLEDLGRPEAARVHKAAAIAEAQARQNAEQERMRAEEAIAEAERNLAVKKATVQAEIDAANARSASAGPIAQAETEQSVLAERQKVAEQAAELRQRQLDVEVRRPADAARYQVEQEAEAERARRGAAAEAVRLEAAAEAQAILARGEAEAAALRARGEAEAAAMRAKAEAFGGYGQAAVLDLLVRVLPEVVDAASRPIGEIDAMTVISTDGASALTKSVASNVAQGLQLGSDLTGIDLRALLAGLAQPPQQQPAA